MTVLLLAGMACGPCLLGQAFSKAAPVAVPTVEIVRFTNVTGGVVIDSDRDSVRPGAAFDREAIQAESGLRVRNAGALTNETVYTLEYRLLDPAGVPHPIFDAGRSTTNSGYVHAGEVRVPLPPGGSTRFQHVARIIPAAPLDPRTAYRVEMVVLTNGVACGARTNDAGRSYLHFTSLVSNDPRLNVLGIAESAVITSPFALRAPGSPSAFVAEARVRIHRYDTFLAAAPTPATVGMHLDLALVDASTGLPVPLASRTKEVLVSVPEFDLVAGRAEPASVLHVEPLSIQPAAGVQLDPVAGRYRLEVTTTLNDAPAPGNVPVAAGLATGSDQGLLQFNGRITGGGVTGTFSSVANVPTDGGPDGAGVRTDLQIAAGVGLLPGGTTFSSTTPIPVRLLADGTAEILSGSFEVSRPGGGATLQVRGFTLSLDGQHFGADGVRSSTSILTFPSGFGVRLGNRNQGMSKGWMSLGSVVLDPATLRPTGVLQWAPEGGITSFCHEESKPLWFEVEKYAWDMEAGTLTFFPVRVVSVRSERYAGLAGRADVAVGGTNGVTKASNDRYWDSVTGVGPEGVVLRADPQGHAVASFTATLAPGAFEAQFPAGAVVAWTGAASLTVSNDVVVPSASTMNAVSNLVQPFEVTCRDCGWTAAGPDSGVEERSLNPVGPFQFTEDGGLIGDGLTPLEALSFPDLAWGKSGEQYTHRVANVSAGRFHMPGTFLPAAVAGAAGVNGPAVLLLTGTDLATGRAVARPLAGDVGYEEGWGEYAGFNYAPTNTLLVVTNRGQSLIAGNATRFTPSVREKLYLRRSGISGIHEASGPVTLPKVYGYDFAVSNLSLAFLDGQNSASALAGSISLPYPANFSYPLEHLRLRCNGHLLDAPRSTTQPGVTLDYWDTTVGVNGVAFEPVLAGVGAAFLPTACTTTDYSVVFDITARPTNRFLLGAQDGFTGRLALGTDGNIRPKSAGVLGVDSRLKGPTQLGIPSADETPFTFAPVNDAYFNTWSAAVDPIPGWLNLAGSLNVAFFEDVKVHLHVDPSGPFGALYVMGGGPVAGFTQSATWWNRSGSDFFNDAGFDADHVGTPPVGVLTYRDGLTEDYNPRAQKLWAGIVKFDYPLLWSTTVGEFNSLAPKEKNLIILKTESRLNHLRGGSTDLSFGAQYAGAPLANLTEMLMEGTGLNDALQDAVGVQLGVLGVGTQRLGDILDADPHRFWDPLLDRLLDPVIADLHAELETLHGQVDPCDFTTQARPVLERYIIGAPGWTNSVSARLYGIAGVYTDAATVLGTVHSQLGEVHDALQAAAGLIVLPEDSTAGPAGTYPGIFVKEQISNGIEARTQVEQMAKDLLTKLGGLAVDSAVEELVGDLMAKSDLPFAQVQKALQDLDAAVVDLRSRLEPSRDYASRMAMIVSSQAASLSVAVEGSLDDTVVYFDGFACGIDDPFEDLTADALKADLKGLVKDRFYASSVPGEVQSFLRELLYDLNTLVADAIDSGVAELNRVIMQVLTEESVGLASEVVPLLGDVAGALGAGSIQGDAQIVGDDLHQLRLDGEIEFGMSGKREGAEEGSMLKAGVQFTLRSYDNDGEDYGCSLGSVPATEVTLAVSMQAVKFITDKLEFQADLLFAFADDPANDPPFKALQVGGGFQVPTYVPIIPALITLKGIGGDASFGVREDFLSANCDVSVLQRIHCTGGFFVGKTCSYKPFDGWAKDVEHVIGLSDNDIARDGWSGLYTEVSANISLGQDCRLRAEFGGGVGAGFRWDEPTLLGRAYGYANGDFLCFIHGGAWFELDALGRLGDLTGGDLFGDVRLKGCAGIEVQVLVKITEEACITYQNGTFNAE